MITVYTAILGDWDYLRPPAVVSSGVRYICYSDRRWPDTPPWEILPAYLPLPKADGARNCRIPKLLSHEFAGGMGDISIWQDANFVMAIDPAEAADRWLANADIACFEHPGRHCLYAEAALCARDGYEDAEVLRAQTAWYEAYGFPRNHWMAACGILLRRHTERVRNRNLAWWKEVLVWGRRDQVAFPYVWWDHPPAFIPGGVYDNSWWVHKHHAWRKGHPDNEEFERQPPAVREWDAKDFAEARERFRHLDGICIRPKP